MAAVWRENLDLIMIQLSQQEASYWLHQAQREVFDYKQSWVKISMSVLCDMNISICQIYMRSYLNTWLQNMQVYITFHTHKK